MHYPAKILALEKNDYEGLLLLEIQSVVFSCSYQAPLDFAEQYLSPGSLITVDLWMMFNEGKARIVRDYVPSFPKDVKIAGGTVQGSVTAISSHGDLRLDCGDILIDVHSNGTFAVGTCLQIRGTYQVFFPNTGYSYEEMGPI